MSQCVKGVSFDLVEKYRSAMLYDNMDISRLMVHAQQVEVTRLERRNREIMRAKSYEGGTSKGSLENEDETMFNNRV